MHYDTRIPRSHGLPHDPFKALVVPRPIGWVATRSADGVLNLAPYSFFNGISDAPPMVAFSVAGHKDTLRNVQATGEFTCSLATWALRDAMNMSSAAVAPQVDEFQLAGLTPAASRLVTVPRVAESPAALECTLWQTIALPPAKPGAALHYTLVIGHVVGVHIDDACLRDGRVDIGALKPLARLGYMDYAVVTPESLFSLNRPLASPDGLSAEVPPGEWDGVFR